MARALVQELISWDHEPHPAALEVGAADDCRGDRGLPAARGELDEDGADAVVVGPGAAILIEVHALDVFEGGRLGVEIEAVLIVS
jgi:hypothetical protein